LWTSANHKSFLAVVVHYCSPAFKIESVLIGFRELFGPHSGENIAALVEAVVVDYDIESQLGCFILDNATNNDTCLATMAKTYGWSKKEVLQRRLRCFGHIINLVAQAFVFGAQSEIFEQTLEVYEKQIQDGTIKLWELRGPIGKLHYVVLYILKTPQRLQRFLAGFKDEVSPTDLMPKRDNSTRWNSVYYMIQRALRLKDNLDVFCSLNTRDRIGDEGLLSSQILTPVDWVVLTQIAAGLALFEEVTIDLQGFAKDAQFGAMWESIPVLERLGDRLLDLQTQFPLAHTFQRTEVSTLHIPHDEIELGLDPSTEFIAESVNHAWKVYTRYYDLTDRSTWYIAGMVLNPMQKWKYFTYVWKDKKGWIATAKSNMKELWELQYKPTRQRQQEAQLTAAATTEAQLRRQESNLVEHTFAWQHDEEQQRRKKPKIEDQYDIYCSTDTIKRGEVTDLIAWWGERLPIWPELARFALDALSIPAMSAECERCFSCSGRLISNERASLEAPAVEACMCTGHWYRHGYA
jgi:hypothetical protein